MPAPGCHECVIGPAAGRPSRRLCTLTVMDDQPKLLIAFSGDRPCVLVRRGDTNVFDADYSGEVAGAVEFMREHGASEREIDQARRWWRWASAGSK